MKSALAIALLCGLAADAAACPGLVLDGDPAVVAEIAELLARRAVDAGCVRGRIERRGEGYLVEVTAQDGERVAHVVQELATAATVIESVARRDVTAPLLAIRARPAREPEPAIEPPRERGPQSTVMRGVQLFGALETSVATDATRWGGLQLGVCIALGPVCPAARLRVARVASDHGVWSELDRVATELLVGIDIPLALTKRFTLSPGFAAGLGALHTGTDDAEMGHESAGPRADAHATLSIQLSRRWAVDVSVAADMTQQTRKLDRMASDLVIPDEPLALLRFGVGFRYGGL